MFTYNAMSYQYRRGRKVIRLVNKEEYRVCADCDGTMRKMPGLTGVWMCERCSSLNYRLPAEWEMSEDDEDQTLYHVENSGE
jgi:ribosomal protein L37AE/L43A